jgi:hypothetical protein
MFSFVCFSFNFSPPIPYSVACIFLSEVQLHCGLAESFGRVPNRKLVGASPKLHWSSTRAPPKLTSAPPELTATSINTSFHILASFPFLLPYAVITKYPTATVMPITQSPVEATIAPNSMSFVIRDRGNAWAWIEPSITKGQSSYQTWEEFNTAITRAFGEADSNEVARRKFKSIRQGNRSAAAYWAEFQ